MNPFHHSLEDNFRGRRVRAVSNAGEAYEGWVERMHHHDRHVVLRDATHLGSNEDVGAVMVSHADVLEVVEPTSRIEAVAVDAIEPAPYHAAEFELAGNRGYVAEVRDRQFVGSFPVARERADGVLEVVEGHKRLWACEQAGLDEHPVEIVDVDEWEATRRFVADHLPDEEQVNDDGSTPDGYYNDRESEAALDALVERWGDRILEVERVAFNARRLDVDIVQDAEEADAEHDAEDEYACDVEGCDYSSDSERGLAIHQGRVHSDEDDGPEEAEDDVQEEVVNDEPPLDEQIADVLEEEGEVSSKEIELLLETSSSHYRNVLSEMQRDGRVESRRDPDDGRRRLYQLATEDEDDVDERDESFPRECHCGATLEDSLELAIHRTEEHDVPQANLAHLEAGEFEAIVREADGLQDVVDEVGWSPEKTLRVIGMYDLGDALGRPEEPDVDEDPATTDGGDEADDVEPATTAEDDTVEPVEPNGAALDLTDYGTSRDELVDALEGSQTIHHVQRDLRLDRDTTTELLAGLGLLEKFTGGCRPISPGDAESAVREVA